MCWKKCEPSCRVSCLSRWVWVLDVNILGSLLLRWLDCRLFPSPVEGKGWRVKRLVPWICLSLASLSFIPTSRGTCCCQPGTSEGFCQVNLDGYCLRLAIFRFNFFEFAKSLTVYPSAFQLPKFISVVPFSFLPSLLSLCLEANNTPSLPPPAAKPLDIFVGF